VRRIIVIALVAAGLGVAAQPAVAGDKDCSDFKSQKQAQKFFKKHGGPQRDPHNLDGDDDGIACEDLP
jgi:competence protein ComEC